MMSGCTRSLAVESRNVLAQQLRMKGLPSV